VSDERDAPDLPARRGPDLDELTWAGGDEPHSLVELVNRVLDRGVVLQGDVTISVAGVDLVYLGLNALLTSVSTARRTLQRPVGGVRDALPPPERPERADLGAGTPPPGLPPPRPPSPEPESPPPSEMAAGIARDASDTLATRLVEVADSLPSRIEVDPDGVQRDLGRLVLTLVELLRRVVEHQAVRRMDDDDLTDEQIERMGVALQRLAEKMQEIRAVFGLAEEELNIDLGPLGKLL
jgi:hypothetical protein